MLYSVLLYIYSSAVSSRNAVLLYITDWSPEFIHIVANNMSVVLFCGGGVYHIIDISPLSILYFIIVVEDINTSLYVRNSVTT